MTRLPVIIQRGVQEHTILAPSREAFRNLLNSLKARFSRVKIRQIRSFASGLPKHNLTVKQMEATSMACSSGYYDIPRKITVTEMSERLGIRRVAMQERLRRAERTIMSDFVEGTATY
jgi:predicted DNA binding protein